VSFVGATGKLVQVARDLSAAWGVVVGMAVEQGLARGRGTVVRRRMPPRIGPVRLPVLLRSLSDTPLRPRHAYRSDT